MTDTVGTFAGSTVATEGAEMYGNALFASVITQSSFTRKSYIMPAVNPVTVHETIPLATILAHPVGTVAINAEGELEAKFTSQELKTHELAEPAVHATTMVVVAGLP